MVGGSIRLADEVRYIQQRAANHCGRIVTIDQLMLFSTETGDAWLLDRTDLLAARLARDAEAAPIQIVETATTFAIEWTGSYRINGPAFPSIRIGIPVSSDHGSQYMSDHFQKEIAFLGIDSSPAFVRAPEGNGCAERFIRTSRKTCSGSGTSKRSKNSGKQCWQFRETYNTKWLIERHGFMSPRLQTEPASPASKAASRTAGGTSRNSPPAIRIYGWRMLNSPSRRYSSRSPLLWLAARESSCVASVPSQRSACIRHNPRTGEVVAVGETTKPSFKAGTEMLRRFNGDGMKPSHAATTAPAPAGGPERHTSRRSSAPACVTPNQATPTASRVPGFPSNHKSAHARGIVRGAPNSGAAVAGLLRRVTGRCVAGLRHSPRAAVSPARDGIGSSSAAGRGRPGAGLQYACLGCVRPHASALAQHDPPHRPAADALDAGEQLRLRLPCPAAAAVVTHLRDDGSLRGKRPHSKYRRKYVASTPQGNRTSK